MSGVPGSIDIEFFDESGIEELIYDMNSNTIRGILVPVAKKPGSIVI